MTDAESKLWSRIRRKQLNGFQFYRQKPLARYIVDFYCPKAKLVIELDGGGHYLKDKKREDEKRDQHFKKLEINVLRFSNLDILNHTDSVLEEIINFLQKISPNPSLRKRGK